MKRDVKEKAVYFRCSEAEYTRLQEAAYKDGMNVSEFIRYAINNHIRKRALEDHNEKVQSQF